METIIPICLRSDEEDLGGWEDEIEDPDDLEDWYEDIAEGDWPRSD